LARPRTLARLAGEASLAALALQYVPSIATLGTWTRWRATPGDVVRWAGPDVAKVALTFDDGPSEEATPVVLDRLDRLDLRATFFVLGELAEARPDLVHEVARRGHQVETHGYRHEHHLARGPRWVDRDLARAVEVMAALGHPVRWYRPSYGQLTGSTLLAARRHGLRTVLWSAWGREWTTTEPDEVATRLSSRLGPGGIALLHDNDVFGTPGMWRIGLDALDRVAELLDRRSLAPVTLDELDA